MAGHQEVAALHPVSERAAWLDETAAYLSDIGIAWQDAAPEERTDIAGTRFERVTVIDDRIEEAIVRAAMAPFFVLDNRNDQRKRWASNPRSHP